MWGCFLMSGVKILHFLKDWWKSIPIHQNYTMALTYSLYVDRKVIHGRSYYENYSRISKTRPGGQTKGRRTEMG